MGERPLTLSPGESAVTVRAEEKRASVLVIIIIIIFLFKTLHGVKLNGNQPRWITHARWAYILD